jgi:hypothetical protein
MTPNIDNRPSRPLYLTLLELTTEHSNNYADLRTRAMRCTFRLTARHSASSPTQRPTCLSFRPIWNDGAVEAHTTALR